MGQALEEVGRTTGELSQHNHPTSTPQNPSARLFLPTSARSFTSISLLMHGQHYWNYRG